MPALWTVQSAGPRKQPEREDRGQQGSPAGEQPESQEDHRALRISEASGSTWGTNVCQRSFSKLVGTVLITTITIKELEAISGQESEMLYLQPCKGQSYTMNHSMSYTIFKYSTTYSYICNPWV